MGWIDSARQWMRRTSERLERRPKVGLALGGGFARGIAHVGVLRVLEREKIPVHYIGGVSAGSMVAAAYASGATPDEIEVVARTMKFSHVARWTVSRTGLAGSERMKRFLERLLHVSRFEDMKIPLAVVASDLGAGRPVVFRDQGDVVVPIRASCSYPGLFQPIFDGKRYLVDGMVTMDVPAQPLRDMGATHVISVALPNPDGFECGNMLSIVNRCFQLMSNRLEREWRSHSNIVIQPDVGAVGWRGFVSSQQLIEAGEKAMEAALPTVRQWLGSAVDEPVKAPPSPVCAQRESWLS